MLWRFLLRGDRIEIGNQSAYEVFQPHTGANPRGSPAALIDSLCSSTFRGDAYVVCVHIAASF